METVLITSKTELAATLHAVLDERERQRRQKANLKSFSINQAAKRLKRSHATIKKYVEQGLLATTKDGRIPEVELIKFLESK